MLIQYDTVVSLLLCIEDESVPLALDIIILWLLGNIQTIELQFASQFLFSLEDDERNLDT